MDIVLSVLKSLDFDLTTFICQVVLFFTLHFSLHVLVYQPIMTIRDRRDKRIANNLAEAEAAAAEARRLKDDYEQKVRQARAEGQVALQKATEAAEAERKTRLEKARGEAMKTLTAAREEAEAVLAKAAETLDSQSEQVANAICSKLLTSSLGDSDGKAILSKLGGKA